MTKNESGMLGKCMMALQACGVKITTDGGNVTCVFPPNPNDPHAAPDGEEQTYSEKDFAFIVSRTFLELVEQDTIDAEGNAV